MHYDVTNDIWRLVCTFEGVQQQIKILSYDWIQKGEKLNFGNIIFFKNLEIFIINWPQIWNGCISLLLILGYLRDLSKIH